MNIREILIKLFGKKVRITPRLLGCKKCLMKTRCNPQMHDVCVRVCKAGVVAGYKKKRDEIQLADFCIKGHPSRGGEVIRFLEMIGGRQREDFKYKGCDENSCYYIDDDNFIKSRGIAPVFYTIGYINKNFPYKVGDEVLYKGRKCCIKTMRFNGFGSMYYGVEDECGNRIFNISGYSLQPYRNNND